MFAAVVSNPVPVMVRVVALTARLLVLEVTVGTDTKVKNVLAALVPPGVVTKTLAVPALPAGVVAVMVESVTEIMVAATPSMVTTVAPEKPDPEMVMLVPPVVGPLVGEILDMNGMILKVALLTLVILFGVLLEIVILVAVMLPLLVL